MTLSQKAFFQPENAGSKILERFENVHWTYLLRHLGKDKLSKWVWNRKLLETSYRSVFLYNQQVEIYDMLKISNLLGWDFYLKRTNILKLDLKPGCFAQTQADVFQLGRRRHSKQSLVVFPQILKCQKAKSALVVTAWYSNPRLIEPETIVIVYFLEK